MVFDPTHYKNNLERLYGSAFSTPIESLTWTMPEEEKEMVNMGMEEREEDVRESSSEANDSTNSSREDDSEGSSEQDDSGDSSEEEHSVTESDKSLADEVQEEHLQDEPEEEIKVNEADASSGREHDQSTQDDTQMMDGFDREAVSALAEKESTSRVDESSLKALFDQPQEQQGRYGV